MRPTSILDSCAFFDNVPAGTTYIPGSLAILTNEGKVYKAFSDAAGDDAGSITSGAIAINMGYNSYEDELNTDRFILERSVATNVFESIATVSAKSGPGKKSTYNYIDNKVANLGVPFVSYRLKITDKNGEYSYSNIVVINIPEILITMVNVFPNPASSAATLSITSPKDQKISWQLIDNAGRVILSGNQTIHKGNSRITVDLNNIPACSYFIQVKGLYVNTIQKLQKL